MPTPAKFQYDLAFARNLGLVTEDEQARLRKLRVALPGVGGVGGAHVQALARLGIGRFHLSDLDTFDVGNIQRQLGASMSTLGRPKVDVLAETARGINPEVEVKTFSDGVNERNVAAFLDGVDVVVNGIEFFCMDARRLVHRAARERRIPVIEAGPIGYGAAVLVFTPEGPSFDAYFGMDDEMTRAEQLLAFLLGLTPGLASDIDPKYVDIENQKGPALISACLLCAGTAATEVVKLVTHRGRLAAVPHGVYYDVFRGRTVRMKPCPSLTKSWRGRFLRWMVFRKFPAFRAMYERELAARGS